ncbi:MAG: hypothetical protein ABJE95_22625 [Byssovorax sp.]
MRSRPEIDVELPSSVLPGETFRVTLTVTGRSVTPIDFIRVEFHVDPAEREASSEGRRRSLQTVNVAGRGELREKTYRYRASFKVPDDAPPTYLGRAIERRAWIEVHVAIPRWLDVRERHDVTIVPAPIARPEPEAVTGSSRLGDEPFVEISLGAQCFAPGETIQGAITFGHLGGAHVSDLEAALVGIEALVGRGGGPDRAKRQAHRYPALLVASNAEEGRAIPFRLAVPASAAPSLSLPQGKLFWMLEARLGLHGGSTVTHAIPVSIAFFEWPAGVPSADPTAIDAARWRAIWDEAAATVGLTLDPRKLRLTGELSGCDVSVRVGQSAADRSSLAARLRWRTWGLGLSLSGVGPATRQTYFPAETFKRRFQLTGRDPEQVRAALLPAVHTALLVFDEVTFSDDEAEVHSEAPGHEPPSIQTFLGDVVGLARAIEAASQAIPAPRPMGGFVPAWRQFASDLEGELTVGNMAIAGGEFEGAVFEIRTEIEGTTPIATTIELVIDPPIDPSVDLATVARSQQAVVIRERQASIVALCQPWLGVDAARLASPDLRAGLISLRLPLMFPDPARLRDLMSALLSLASAVRGDHHAGPYR